MNRVYKIVWSKAKNAYVVTSELAKNHTKNASGKMVKTALTAAVGMGVLMGGYMADAAPATNPSGDGPGIAIGTGSSSQKVDSTAVGKNAKTTGERALAVGYNSIADADSAMAVGNGNKAMAGVSLASGGVSAFFASCTVFLVMICGGSCAFSCVPQPPKRRSGRQRSHISFLIQKPSFIFRMPAAIKRRTMSVTTMDAPVGIEPM